jgi:hypothetical protein
MTKPARLIYATLVRGYPRGFRDEYGPAMMQAFDESLHCAIAEQGVLGVFRLAGRLAVDWAKTMLGVDTRDLSAVESESRCCVLKVTLSGKRNP